MAHTDRTPISERYQSNLRLIAKGGVNNIFISNDEDYPAIIRLPHATEIPSGDFVGSQANYIASLYYLGSRRIDILPKIIEHDDGGIVMLQSPGISLTDASKTLAETGNDHELSELGRQSADLMLRLHAITVPQWGLFHPRDEEYIGDPQSNYEYIMGWVERQVSVIRERELLHPDTLEKAVAIITEGRALLDTQAEPRFIHNDFTPLNILVDQNALDITALLDFDRSGGGDPLLDFLYTLTTKEYRSLPEAFRTSFEQRYLEGRAAEGDNMQRLDLLKLFINLQYLPIANNGGGWEGAEEHMRAEIYEATYRVDDAA